MKGLALDSVKAKGRDQDQDSALQFHQDRLGSGFHRDLLRKGNPLTQEDHEKNRDEFHRCGWLG